MKEGAEIVKIQDFFSEMPCDLSNQTTQPAQHFFELFSSKHAHLTQISSINRFTGVTPTRKCFPRGMQKSIFALLLYFSAKIFYQKYVKIFLYQNFDGSLELVFWSESCAPTVISRAKFRGPHRTNPGFEELFIAKLLGQRKRGWYQKKKKKSHIRGCSSWCTRSKTSSSNSYLVLNNQLNILQFSALKLKKRKL